MGVGGGGGANPDEGLSGLPLILLQRPHASVCSQCVPGQAYLFNMCGANPIGPRNNWSGRNMICGANPNGGLLMDAYCWHDWNPLFHRTAL